MAMLNIELPAKRLGLLSRRARRVGLLAGKMVAVSTILPAPWLVMAANPSASAPSRPIRTLIPIASGVDEKISLRVGFTPFQLGRSTTIAFGFRIRSPKNTVPQPLIGINLALPGSVGGGTTKLGLATCNETIIYELGIDRCPANSFVGRGTATAAVPIGPVIIHEQVQVGLFATPSKSGRLEILYGAEGVTPVYDVLVFRGEIVEARSPYGEEIATFIPPIETLPEAPYASVIGMTSTIGPKHLTYYRRVHRHRVPYHPKGIELPSRCPRTGFKFEATFTFLDGATKTIKTTDRCPPAHRR
jgi:hypothetical protein